MLPWGSGHNACPGRFMVQEVFKLIFINLVTKYDMRCVEGVESPPPRLPAAHGFYPESNGDVALEGRDKVLGLHHRPIVRGYSLGLVSTGCM